MSGSKNNNGSTNMTTKLANDIRVDDVVCEADGFMWRVAAVAATRMLVELTLLPVFGGGISRASQSTIRVRKTSMVRVA